MDMTRDELPPVGQLIEHISNGGEHGERLRLVCEFYSRLTVRNRVRLTIILFHEAMRLAASVEPKWQWLVEIALRMPDMSKDEFERLAKEPRLHEDHYYNCINSTYINTICLAEAMCKVMEYNDDGGMLASIAYNIIFDINSMERDFNDPRKYAEGFANVQWLRCNQEGPNPGSIKEQRLPSKSYRVFAERVEKETNGSFGITFGEDKPLDKMTKDNDNFRFEYANRKRLPPMRRYWGPW